MRSYTVRLMTLFIALTVLCGAADARWWIFGKAKEELDFSYLYLNGVSFDEEDTDVTLYRESLPDGMIHIRGKVYTKGTRIGAVQISTDGKDTWNAARLADDATFEYRFQPREGSYSLYIKVIDTTGRTNDIERNHKKIVMSDQSIADRIRTIINELAEAYQQKDAGRFMALVSEDFTGGDVVLDSAVRKDFNAFNHIILRLTVSSYAAGPGGKIHALVRYNRSLVSARDGNTYTNEGLTEFTFSSEGDGLRLFSMKNPLLFGLSEAAQVATGATFVGGNSQILIVNDSGSVQLKPFSEGIAILQGGEEASDIPAPQNLQVTDGLVHHFVDLEFDDPGFDLTDYETVVEESTSASGPWTEVERKAGDTFVRIEYPAGDPRDGTLYYRARLAKDGETSAPSNVVQYVNHY